MLRPRERGSLREKGRARERNREGSEEKERKTSRWEKISGLCCVEGLAHRRVADRIAVVISAAITRQHLL